MKRAALTIAGSDPSGGAGIQADLRTFAAIGVAGLSVITALTTQNSHGVESVFLAPANVVASQLDAILRDTRPDAIKIGMLGGAAQIGAVAEILRRYDIKNIVLDPVFASTSGVPLLDESGRKALVDDLVPLCQLITPNLDESGELGSIARIAVLVKGGHLPDEPLDVLTMPDGAVSRFTSIRIPTEHTHGTGCFLSSAIAAHLALGQPLPTAIMKAKRLLTVALQMPTIVGQRRGYPDATAAAARQSIEDNPTHQARIDRLKGVYVLTDPDLRPDRFPEMIARAAIEGGARIIQLRDKNLLFAEAVRVSQRLAEIAHAQDALFIINDRVDVALAAQADGVHIGPDDLSPQEARQILGPERIIGVSINSIAEARVAAPYASYFGVGAIYGTATKADAGAAIGIGRLAEIKAAFPNHPIVAIGGIALGNIAEVRGAGANAAAVVSAIIAAPNMTEITRQLVARFAAG